MDFVSVIEKKASEAPQYEAFNRSSLHGIKSAVEKLLELIGRDGIFHEYTRHDISHINRLLEILDWIVPPSTHSKMSVADCLMTTLGVYFHDLGMLVTRDEFDKRYQSGFADFKNKFLFVGAEGKDYENKVRKLPADQEERFLYQEFVREHHAERIRSWIVGKTARHLGVADQVVQELDSLLEGFGDKFRRDLGLVCESHHREDLDNLDKYKCSQPYGVSVQETANLQYCAILLRTADLLHVTNDRTPSISFRVINPADPKSIEEWHKQMAIVTVRPKPGLDKEGNVDMSAIMDTIEVHGYFTEPEGFFALTSYLNYARKEIRRSSEWVQTAKKKKGASHEFPWRSIDDSDCEAAGFINKQFEFTLDQAKILDLLTGHTLYNDTTVVLRELVQNSLDAIRVQSESESGYIEAGEVRIVWSSINRSLTIEDNGTGMTQEIIDRHFLKVGSSLYQDDDFRKNHPNFSAISRFGIGVLSTFMISDEIEVVTCHPDDEFARVISLRSLHGKYLIRLLDKDSTALPPHISPHGTRICLRVRSSAELKDLLTVLRRWIVFPRCKVTVEIDGAAPLAIGFQGPKEALQATLTGLGLLKAGEMSSGTGDAAIRIEHGSQNGVTLAFAVVWSAYFQEWNFFQRPVGPRTEVPLIGTCVEGIRVDFASPGFSGYSILAIANSVGPNAPKTNVARSGFEATPEREKLLRTIYDLYCKHVKNEVEALHKERHFSLTWALGETEWLLSPLFQRSHPVEDPDLPDMKSLLDAAADIPSVPLEINKTRIAASPNELSSHASIWTVDSALFASAEAIIREAPAPIAVSKLAEAMGFTSPSLPPGPFISFASRRSIVERLAFQNREVDRVILYPRLRRIDLRWRRVGETPLWREVLPQAREIRTMVQAAQQRRPTEENAYLAQGHIEQDGREGEVAFRSVGRLFILPSPLCEYLLRLLEEIEVDPKSDKVLTYAIALNIFNQRSLGSDVSDYFKKEISRIGRKVPIFDRLPDEDSALIDLIRSTNTVPFDPRAWSRGIPYWS